MRIASPLVRLSVAVLALAALSSGADAASSRKKRLKRDELVQLFGNLTKAAKSATTFQASMKRTDVSMLFMDEEPMASEGKLWIERPSRFRQDINTRWGWFALKRGVFCPRRRGWRGGLWWGSWPWGRLCLWGW